MGLCNWWIQTDGCGVCCGFITPSMIIFALIVQLVYVLGPSVGYSSPITIFYGFISIMAILSHARTQFTNPGAVPLKQDRLMDLENGDNKHNDLNSINNNSNNINNIVNNINNVKNQSQKARYCQRCKQNKPQNAHHCSICQRCILRMDHHCPWVNNCVGMCNQKYFLLFLMYTCLCCVFCLISLTSRFIYCNSIKSDNDINNDRSASHLFSAQSISHNNNDDNIINHSYSYCGHVSPIDNITCVLNFFEGILFGLFTLIMSCDQLSNIYSGLTYIDTLKHNETNNNNDDDLSKQNSGYELLKMVFGEPFGIGWFLPKQPTAKLIKDFDGMCQDC